MVLRVEAPVVKIAVSSVYTNLLREWRIQKIRLKYSMELMGKLATLAVRVHYIPIDPGEGASVALANAGRAVVHEGFRPLINPLGHPLLHPHHHLRSIPSG